MNKYSAGGALIARRVVLVALWLSVVPAGRAGDATPPAASEAYNYAEPKLLTGTLYAVGSHRKTILYTFRRIATRSGAIVHVERQFFGTNGVLAAVDKVTYESNQVVTYGMQDFQARVSGAIWVEPDPENPARQDIFISYGPGLHSPTGQSSKPPVRHCL